MIVGTLKPMTYTLPSVGWPAGAAPIRSALIAGHVNHFFEPNRRERAFIPGLRDALPELLTFLRRQDVRIQIVHRELLAGERRRLGRERAAWATPPHLGPSSSAVLGRSSIGQIGSPVTRSKT